MSLQPSPDSGGAGTGGEANGLPRLIANAILAMVLGAAVVALLCAVNRGAAPQARVLPPVGTVPSDYQAVLNTVTEAAVEKHLRALVECGSRFSGQPGCDQAATHIASALKGWGYEVLEQPFLLTVPVTRYARLLDADGKPVEGVTVHPFLPNWHRTCTVPAGGIRGTVYRGDQGLAREFEGRDLRGNFVLLPLDRSWGTVAGMGAGAVFFYQEDAEKPVSYNWHHNVDACYNVPRLFVQGDVQKLAGQTLTLDVRVDWEEREVRNVIGLLEAKDAQGEALLLSAYYDAYSFVPDLAPGASQACSPAALLAAAEHLAAEAAAHRRTVILAFTVGHGQGLFGIREFMTALGVRGGKAKALAEARVAQAAAVREAETAGAAWTVLGTAAYWEAGSEEAEARYWQDRQEKADDLRAYVEETVKRVIDHDLMAALEELNDARVDWVRNDLIVKRKDEAGALVDAEEFTRYVTARTDQDFIKAVISTPVTRIKAFLKEKERYRSYATRGVVRRRIGAEAQARSERAAQRVEEATALAALADRLASCDSVLGLMVEFTAKAGQVAMACGDLGAAPLCMPADDEVATQFRRAITEFDALGSAGSFEKTPTDQPRFQNLLRDGRDRISLPFANTWEQAPYFETPALVFAGRPAFLLATLGDGRQFMGTPFDQLEPLLSPKERQPGAEKPIAGLAIATQLFTAAASQLARGMGRIVPVNQEPELYTIRGRVVSQVGEDLTPNHPMPGSLVNAFVKQHGKQRLPGIGDRITVTADWHGEFSLKSIWGAALSQGYHDPVQLDAAVVRPEDGEVIWALSKKSAAGSPYSVENIPISRFQHTRATAVVFRSAAVQLFPMVDPTTMRPYQGFGLLEAKSMALPLDWKIEADGRVQGQVCFVPPDARLFFTFRKGRKENPNLMEIRAFALNAEGPADGRELEGKPELYGRGYLATDNPTITNIELDASLSMAQTNARRVRMQARYGMTDPMITSFSRTAIAYADEAESLAHEGKIIKAKEAASSSIAYSSNIHPVIRKNASDAVWGILFYLFLAMPFAIFMEKLLVGHPDIRYQIFFQGVIFLLFFLALWSVHPAFELVRSSYMILLGFVTFALAAMVGTFVSARFSTNVKELHRKVRQQIETADVSRAGAAATAFLLGLNNMRKRPVRTGLTVVTLILITFVMICCTSVSTDLVDIEFPIGKAPYTGILVRDRNQKDVGSSLMPLRELYGKEHYVSPRGWGGSFQVSRERSPERAEYTVQHVVSETRTEEAVVNGLLGLSTLEPKLLPVAEIFEKGLFTRWFDEDDEYACFLPRPVASTLMVDDEAVKRGEAAVRIGGHDYKVLGIYDPLRLEALLDLDGQGLLPIDIVAMREPPVSGGKEAEADSTDLPEDQPRLPGESVIITPVDRMPARNLIASIGVNLVADKETGKQLDYADARAVIMSHLERSGEAAFYGIDGVSFYGGKFRMGSLEGFLDLLLPIILAAMTVLNTMRGSVYERKNELYVFNAVGLAPNHIRFLFMAEACVYAVVGAVGGYLLAQGMGTLLDEFQLKERLGLTMNYSSISVVLVTVVIMAVVFISSIFPARMAARLAAPAETMTRQRESAAGEQLELDLPFTFSHRDRVAIVPYFMDWFDEYGEGSTGEFFCSPPQVGVRTEAHGGAAPVVQTTTWLRPYDLGVSQLVEMVVRHDRETKDNIATVIMTRKSGDHESWERCCHAFIGLLRKRFLTWRAVGAEDRDLLLERARQMLDPAQAAQRGGEAVRDV